MKKASAHKTPFINVSFLKNKCIENSFLHGQGNSCLYALADYSIGIECDFDPDF